MKSVNSKYENVKKVKVIVTRFKKSNFSFDSSQSIELPDLPNGEIEEYVSNKVDALNPYFSVYMPSEVSKFKPFMII